MHSHVKVKNGGNILVLFWKFGASLRNCTMSHREDINLYSHGRMYLKPHMASDTLPHTYTHKREEYPLQKTAFNTITKRRQNYRFPGSDAVYSGFRRACCFGFQIPSTRSKEFPPKWLYLPSKSRSVTTRQAAVSTSFRS